MTKQSSLFLKITLAFFGIALTTSSLMFGAPNTANANRSVSKQNWMSESDEWTPTSSRQAPTDFRLAARKAIPAVVSIQVQANKRSPFFGEDSNDTSDLFGTDLWQFFGIPRRSQPMVGEASGVIISPDGYILTNNHVVNKMDSILVRLNDGREYKAKVLGQDPNMDLALIKIEAQDLPYLKLADSRNLEVGEWVAAIGNPFSLRATLTVGVISAKGRNNLDIIPNEDFIQTDASINRGNSGGALVNLDGDLVGINTAIATTSAASNMGIGFAIPSNMASYFIDEILANGKVSRGFLGIQPQSIDYNLAQALGLNKVQGALVASVVKGSAADNAKIKSGDVILEFNGRPVENAADLRNTAYMMKPGTKIVLKVLRQDQTFDVPIIVGDLSEEKQVVKSSTRQQQYDLGVEVSDLTPDLAQTLGYTEDKGIVVTKVKPNSFAALAGLKKGALIISVNRQPVENTEQFYAALRETPNDRPLLLHVKLGERSMFLSLKVE